MKRLLDQFCAQYGYESAATAEYLSLENAGPAAGCQALSSIAGEMTPAKPNVIRTPPFTPAR
jgi:hypothetical protein